MSTGVASSSPQDCLSLIKSNITAAHAAIGSAESMASPAPGESPLEGFLSRICERVCAFICMSGMLGVIAKLNRCGSSPVELH